MHKAAKSRGWSISFRAEGDGPPLVLLHGWSQWSDQWREYGYAGQLTARFRVIAVDLLGHGESDRPHDPDEYAEALLVADIVAVLDAEEPAAPVSGDTRWGASRRLARRQSPGEGRCARVRW